MVKNRSFNKKEWFLRFCEKNMRNFPKCKSIVDRKGERFLGLFVFKRKQNGTPNNYMLLYKMFRWRMISYKNAPEATETLREEIVPSIGSLAF